MHGTHRGRIFGTHRGRLAKLVLVAACALTAAACAGQARSPARKDDPARELFQRNCAVCHGPEGEGQQVGALAVPSLGAARTVGSTDERLSQQIHDGGGQMPPFKYTLTDEQIQALVRFIREDIQRKGEKGKG